MRTAVLVAMTAIALSSTPLVRLAFCPDQQTNSVPALHAGAHHALPAHAEAPGRGSMSGLETRSPR